MKQFLLGWALLFTLGASAQQVAKGLTAGNGQYIGFYEYRPTDYGVDPSIKYPLIIFLHGIGERGNGTTDLPRVLANGIPKNINAGNKMRFYWNGKWETFLVLSPQLSSSYGGWQNFYVDEMIKYAKANLSIDTNRIILTGLSLGGGGVWQYASSSLANARQLAAISPTCGTCSIQNACNIANANLPLWAFHANDDPTVGAGCTTGQVRDVINCGAAVIPYTTIYPTGGHGIWVRSYDTTYTWQNPNLYEWFLAQNKSLPVNVRPHANAGNDVTISSTVGVLSLSSYGSYDSDGHLERYIWRKISGPPFGTFNNYMAPVTTITGLNMTGTYQYELTVVDDRCDLAKDTVTVTITGAVIPNIPPVSEAGADQVTLTSTAQLDGSFSYDPDGTIAAYQWSRVAGPSIFTISNPNAAAPSLTGLLIGDYSFELQTTDNKGAVNRDTIIVSSGITLLPMRWIYFTGISGEGQNLLRWATEREYQNDHFEIERSSDGANFTTVGSIRGSGTAINEREYQFADPGAENGKTWYRIKQVSADGKGNYSEIIALGSQRITGGIQFYPNPARQYSTLVVTGQETGNMDISIFSIDGHLLQRKNVNKKSEMISVALDLHQYKQGVYLVTISMDNGYREVRKLTKL